MTPTLAEELAGRYGTPLYAYDLDQVERRTAELRTCLPAGAALLYSLKANPLPGIARALAAVGLGAEISSSGELAVSLAAGFPPNRILYTGPGKTKHEIGAAVAAGVEWFSCESPEDHRRLREGAHAADASLSLLFRLNPREDGGGRLVMSGAATQFGFGEEELLEFLLRAERMDPCVRTRGIHVYFGTQVRDPTVLGHSLRVIRASAHRLLARAGQEPEVIDFGGGFPWPFARPDPPSSLAATAAAVHGALHAEKRTEYWFESGRYLVASAGTLLTTVLDVKHSGGRWFVVVDAGINHLGGMAGLGRIHLPSACFASVRPAGAEGRIRADIVGPLCSPLDVLARDHGLGNVRPGDLLSVPNVGAYGATGSLTTFLGRPSAAEVTHRSGRVEEVFRLRTGHERIGPA